MVVGDQVWPAQGAFHHFRLIGPEGKPVAGLTLNARKPWRGLQTATIDRVYTDGGHR